MATHVRATNQPEASGHTNVEIFPLFGSSSLHISLTTSGLFAAGVHFPFSCLVKRMQTKGFKSYIKTYWPAGGGRGQNPENTAQGPKARVAALPRIVRHV